MPSCREQLQSHLLQPLLSIVVPSILVHKGLMHYAKISLPTLIVWTCSTALLVVLLVEPQVSHLPTLKPASVMHPVGSAFTPHSSPSGSSPWDWTTLFVLNEDRSGPFKVFAFIGLWSSTQCALGVCQVTSYTTVKAAGHGPNDCSADLRQDLWQVGFLVKLSTLWSILSLVAMATRWLVKLGDTDTSSHPERRKISHPSAVGLEIILPTVAFLSTLWALFGLRAVYNSPLCASGNTNHAADHSNLSFVRFHDAHQVALGCYVIAAIALSQMVAVVISRWSGY